MEPPIGGGARRQGKSGKCVAYAADAKPGRLPRRSGQDARHSGRERHGERPAAGRRLRPQVEMGLRAGSRAGVEGHRRADQAGVDARGRHPARFLPHGVGRADRRRAWTPSGKVVAWRHRSVAPTILPPSRRAPTTRRRSNSAWGWSTTRSTSPTCVARTAQCEAHTRIGWFRSVSNIPHGFAVQSMVAEIAAALGRDPKEMLLELIGPDRIVDPRKSPDVANFWNYGDPFETYPIDTARLRRVAETRGAASRLGQDPAEGRGPRHRRASQLPDLRRDRGACRGGRQGRRSAMPAGGHRDRLRLPHQPGADPLADRRARR